MKWIDGEIDGVIVRPAVMYRDARGWLAEMFRSDEMPSEIMPMMSYVSATHPGVTRGPHEHREQTDTFGFLGPGNFRIKLWDHRAGSCSHGHSMTFVVGADNPVMVTVPPGVVHGYTNVSDSDAWVLNFPNRLFAGEGKKDPVDEIRHEDREDGEFPMEE